MDRSFSLSQPHGSVPLATLLRALAQQIVQGGSLAKLYAELLARTVAEASPTLRREFESALAEAQRQHDAAREEEWDPPRPALERMRAQATAKTKPANVNHAGTKTDGRRRRWDHQR
jgi:hypothetical protein